MPALHASEGVFGAGYVFWVDEIEELAALDLVCAITQGIEPGGIGALEMP